MQTCKSFYQVSVILTRWNMGSQIRDFSSSCILPNLLALVRRQLTFFFSFLGPWLILLLTSWFCGENRAHLFHFSPSPFVPNALLTNLASACHRGLVHLSQDEAIQIVHPPLLIEGGHYSIKPNPLPYATYLGSGSLPTSCVFLCVRDRKDL